MQRHMMIRNSCNISSLRIKRVFTKIYIYRRKKIIPTYDVEDDENVVATLLYRFTSNGRVSFHGVPTSSNNDNNNLVYKMQFYYWYIIWYVHTYAVCSLRSPLKNLQSSQLMTEIPFVHTLPFIPHISK